MTEDMWDSIIGDKVKVVYWDGDEDRTYRGKLHGQDDNFVKVGDILFNKTEIIKIDPT